jgi:hypothetical protein
MKHWPQISLSNLMIAVGLTGAASAFLAIALKEPPLPNRLLIWPGLMGTCLSAAFWVLAGQRRMAIWIGVIGGSAGLLTTLLVNWLWFND